MEEEEMLPEENDSALSEEKEQEFILNVEEEIKNDEMSNENIPAKKASIIADIMKACQERKKLACKNNLLQHKLSLFLKESIETEKFQSSDLVTEGNEDMFRKILGNIDDKQKEIEEFQQKSVERMELLKAEIHKKEDELKELNSSFTVIKEKTALQSVNSDNGERYDKNEVQELLRKEDEMWKALQHYHLEALKTQQVLEKTKEEKKNMIAGPLDYGEYEVMCTATENNIEVIKQLKEEIKVLMKKSANTVHIFSHLVQKLHSLQSANSAAEERQKQLEEELTGMRNVLFKEKNKYSKINEKNEDLQHKTMLLQYPRLLEDHKQIVIENEEAKKELEKMKSIYKNTKKLLLQ